MEVREEIKKLETEMLFLKSEMQKSDGRASKCAKLGISFKEEYPIDYQNYVDSNRRYNEIEKELEKLYEEEREEINEMEEFKSKEDEYN